ncbi:MAG TPA: DUF3221 domain-containing protein [Longimicrobium sp.]|nr:DUF3221 domain-containing protein [Longimicrobium sp.]
MRNVFAIAALAACLALQGCNGAPEGPDALGLDVIPDGSASIIGDIKQADPGGNGTRILVEQIPTRSAGYPVAWVSVNRRTVVVERGAGGLARSSPDALTVGTRVQVWFNGPVAESYPVQASAGTIVIER